MRSVCDIRFFVMGHNSQVDRALVLPAQFKALQLNPYEVLGTKGVRNKGCQEQRVSGTKGVRTKGVRAHFSLIEAGNVL